MVVTLTLKQVEDITELVRPLTANLTREAPEHVRKAAYTIINEFKKAGITVFTRKDVHAILSVLQFETNGPAWSAVSTAITACSTPEGRRGYYVVNGALQAPAVIPVKESKVELIRTVPANPSNVDLSNLYEEDEGLRRIAASQTACFTSFLENDKNCAVCPLQKWCVSARDARLEEIAVALDKKIGQPDVPVEPPKPAPVTGAVDFESIKAFLLSKGHKEPREVPLPLAAACSKCDKALEQGTMAVYVVNVGVFHHACTYHI